MPTGRDRALATSGADRINPEAGDHQVTADPRELVAAREASERSMRTFPYYERRFGDRGRRFGDSDSAWLITLCSMQADTAKEQIFWLARVLATRGMPRYLLERHLEFLYEALVRAKRQPASAYKALAQGARALHRARTRRIDDETFRTLAAEFRGREVERVGELLVSAVADEADGITTAVSSIESWACDEQLFGGEWISAVRATIAAARKAVR